MQIKNLSTNEIFEIEGSVNKLVHCHSFVNGDGVTVTVDFEENTTVNSEYEIVAEE
ncbi:MAG: hypothetical protein Q8M99_11830 [Methylotenera sp.]|nr:hypothetical protein [Methylotenera sp.]